MNALTVLAPVVLALVMLEALLGFDNALAIASMVAHLPERQRTRARAYGLAGAALFRVVALVFAQFLTTSAWLRLAGAGYLFYLMCRHLGVASDGKHSVQQTQKPGFWGTVITLQVTDLAFSIDNIVAAVAMSKDLWAIVLGVTIGMVAMFFVAGLFSRLLIKFPILEPGAYVLVGVVGLQMFLEEFGYFKLHELAKFAGLLTVLLFVALYGYSARLQRLLRPTVAWLSRLMGAISTLVDELLYPLTALCRRLLQIGASGLNRVRRFRQ